MAVNYLYPGSGATNATATQAAGASLQTGQIGLGTADTTFTLTHNWNFSTAALARLCPLVRLVSNAAAVMSSYAVGTRAANTVTVNVTVTTGGTFEFFLERPHSIIMPNT